MSPLYLYAVLGAAPSADAGAGLAGEPLRLLRCGEVLVAAGEMTEAPAIAPETLRAHDAVVRRLADTTDAILPARFGMIARDESVLCARLEPAASSLREALARVAGREQMILRVFRAPAPSTDAASSADVTASAGLGSSVGAAPSASLSTGTAGQGARYLAERASARRAAAEVPEIAALRPVLDRFVTAERVERHDAPPLVASVYHLVARGGADVYAEAVEHACAELCDVRITISGPWAPYAFAPDALE